MIWKTEWGKVVSGWRGSYEPKQDNFPTFHHQEARIKALEVDFLALINALLGYVVDDTHISENHLVDTLQTIINNRAGLSKK